jgi:hypothetical protein
VPRNGWLVSPLRHFAREKDRYLEVQQDILEAFVDRQQLRELTQPTILANGKRIPV